MITKFDYINIVFTSYRFRRMQVVTPFEAVRLRFGPGSQLFFTWARLPFMLVFEENSIDKSAKFLMTRSDRDARLTLVIPMIGMVVSKIATALFGLVMIASAMLWETMREVQLFDLLNQAAISIGLPMSIPLFFGLFWRRTPRWAAWSTVLAGFSASFIVKFGFTPAMFAWIPGMEGPFLPEETTTFYIFASVFVVGSVCPLVLRIERLLQPVRQ